jgi:hypothetical protein
MRDGKLLRMNRLVCVVALGVILVMVGAFSAPAAGPITKQNGGTPVFKDFTSICAVSGYVNYGYCGGDSTKYTGIKGRVNAVQAKVGVWNLGLSFANLDPGAGYKLWGHQDTAAPIPGVMSGFFPMGTTTAALDGTARFSYQTSNPSGLGFDLNILDSPWDAYGWTVVTSYWSEQAIQVLKSDGTLYVPGS